MARGDIITIDDDGNVISVTPAPEPQPDDIFARFFSFFRANGGSGRKRRGYNDNGRGYVGTVDGEYRGWQYTPDRNGDGNPYSCEGLQPPQDRNGSVIMWDGEG